MNGFDAGYAGTPLRSFLPVQLSLLEELARFRPQRYRGRGGYRKYVSLSPHGGYFILGALTVRHSNCTWYLLFNLASSRARTYVMREKYKKPIT